MKYYKLLKDLPTFKAGDLFYINPDQGCLVQKDTLILAYAKRTLEKFPNILTDWFEEMPEEYKRWRAKGDYKYWYIDSCGQVDYYWEFVDNEDDSYIIGNYFKTEEEAKAYKEYLIARQVLLDDAEGGKYLLCEDNWHAFYSRLFQEWTISVDNPYNPGVIYFKARKALEKSLKEHKEQWEIVRKYEMGK